LKLVGVGFHLSGQLIQSQHKYKEMGNAYLHGKDGQNTATHAQKLHNKTSISIFYKIYIRCNY